MSSSSVLGEFLMAPSPADGPQPVGYASADAQRIGDFLVRHACEVAKLYRRSDLGAVLLQFVKRFMDRQHFRGISWLGDAFDIDVDALHRAVRGRSATPRAFTAGCVTSS